MTNEKFSKLIYDLIKINRKVIKKSIECSIKDYHNLVEIDRLLHEIISDFISKD